MSLIDIVNAHTADAKADQEIEDLVSKASDKCQQIIADKQVDVGDLEGHSIVGTSTDGGLCVLLLDGGRFFVVSIVSSDYDEPAHFNYDGTISFDWANYFGILPDAPHEEFKTAKRIQNMHNDDRRGLKAFQEALSTLGKDRIEKLLK
jgi:hypothetical protein